MKVKVIGTGKLKPWPNGREVTMTRTDATRLSRIGAVRLPDPAPLRDPLDDLRAEAEAAGVHVDRRWGEVRLRSELDAARRPRSGYYSRRDMVAEED